MNLNDHDRLKALVSPPHVFAGSTLHFRKLSAAAWRDLCKEHATIGKVDELGHPLEDRDILWWFGLVLSKQLCDAAGNLTHDTPDALAALQGLTIDEITDLGQRALAWSGVAREPEDAKKN